MMTPMFVAVKIRKCHMMETMIQAGRYASEMLRCHELHALISTLKDEGWRGTNSVHDTSGIKETHNFKVRSQKISAFSSKRSWQLVRYADITYEPKRR